MITKISLCDPDCLIPWSLDIELFKRKYPSIYDVQKKSLSEMMDYEEWEMMDYIDEILPEVENTNDLTSDIESVTLYFTDGTTHPIYNTELLRFNGMVGNDGYSINYDAHFVYFIIYKAAYQAGSLGIWSIKDKNWIFTHSDETFCVDSIIYSESADIFIGLCEWSYPMSPHGGEYLFVVNGERSYADSSDNKKIFTKIEVGEIQEANFSEISIETSTKLSGRDYTYLCFDANKSVVLTIKQHTFEILSAYKLDLQQCV